MSVSGKNVFRSIDITIVNIITATTHPPPYSKPCDTSRPRVGACATTRTGLGRKRFIHFFKPGSARYRFVAEHISEGRPGCVVDAFCHLGLGESGGIDVAGGDVIEVTHQSGRQLVQEVLSRVGDASMDARRPPSFASTLRPSKGVLQLAKVTRAFDYLPSGHHGEALQTQVDADTVDQWSLHCVGDFERDVEKPVASGVAREVSPVLDLALGQGSGVEDAKGVARKAKRIASTLQLAAFDRHPAETRLAAPPQKRSPLLASRFGVLLTHRVDGAGVQSKQLAAAGGQAVQVETRRPNLSPFQRLPLDIVAVVPDVVHCSRLSVQQSVERLHAVAVDEHHTVHINSYVFSPQSFWRFASALYLPVLKDGVSRDLG